MPHANGPRQPSKGPRRRPTPDTSGLLPDGGPDAEPAWSAPETQTQVLPDEGYDESFSPIAIVAGGRVYHLARDRLGIVKDILVK